MTKRILTLCLMIICTVGVWAGDVVVTSRTATNELFRLERQGPIGNSGSDSYFISGGSMSGTLNAPSTDANTELGNTWQIATAERYLGITLPTGITFAEGDVITITGGFRDSYKETVERGFTLKNNTTESSFTADVLIQNGYTANKKETFSYIVAAASPLIGSSSLYVYMKTSKAFVEKIVVTRTDADDLVPNAVTNTSWNLYSLAQTNNRNPSTYSNSAVIDNLYYGKGVREVKQNTTPLRWGINMNNAVNNEFDYTNMQNALSFVVGAGKHVVVVSWAGAAPNVKVRTGMNSTTLTGTSGTADDLDITPVYYTYDRDYDTPFFVEKGSSGNATITNISVAPESVTIPTIENTATNKYTVTPGTSNAGPAVTISTYYTTDGNNPTSESTPLPDGGVIDVTEGMTLIKVISISSFGAQSEVLEQAVTYQAPATQYTLTISDMTNGTVTVDGEENVTSKQIDENSTATIVALPNNGYVFGYWMVDGVKDESNTSKTLVVTMDANKTIKAVFAEPDWSEVNDFTNLYTNKDNITVVVDKFANEVSVCNDPVDDSTKKTITYEYKGGDGWHGITVNGISFQMNRSSAANFVLDNNYLEVVAASGRIVIPSVTAGKIVTVTAYPKSSTLLLQATSGGTASSNNPSEGVSSSTDFKFKSTGGDMIINYSGGGNARITKVTIRDAYTVTAVPEDENYGTATIEPSWIGDNKYEKTSNVEVTAAGLGDYAFDHWSVAGNDSYSTENPLTIENLSADIALTAHYRARVTYTFSATASPTEGGTITAYKDDDETNAWTIASPVYEGTKIKLVAGANDGYTFVNWKKGSTVVSTEATYTIESLSENTELTANFISTSSIVPVILTAGQSNTDGRISDAIPSDFTGLTNCYWSYCNAQNVPSGTFLEENRRYTPGFELFTQRSDNGTCWGYDAVVYDLVGKALNSNFYVVKQSKGNTAVSPDAGGCGVYWGADNIYRKGDSWAYDTTWFGNQTSVNSGGLSLLKGFIENIDASMSALETDGKHGDIKFMLWHQGECDGGSGNTAFAYYENLKAVVNYVRNYLATNYDSKYATLPFICGTVAKNSKEYHAYVENALYRLQKDLTNFYVVNMSQGTFIADGVHFNQESAVRLGKKMYNKVVENGYITGSTVEVDDVDAQIYNENTYDFQNWAYVNSEITTKVGGTNPAYKAISLGSAVDGTDNTLFVLNNPTKDEGMQADMSLGGRFALSNVTSNGAANDDVNFRISQLSNGATGLHTKANATPTFSILNLNPGDAVTITCNSDAVAFKSTNAYLATDEEKVKVTEGAKWATGKSYVVTSGNRIDLTFGGTEQKYIYSVTITPGSVTETVTDPVISSNIDNGTATVTITVDNTELGNTPAIYYTTDGTEPSANSTLYSEQLAFTEETTLKAIAVVNNITSNVVTEDITTTIQLTDPVTYDFMAAYNGDNSPAITYGDAVANALHYYRQSDSSERNAASYPVILASPFAPELEGRLSTNGTNITWAAKGLSVADNRAVAIHNLKVGDVIRIEYDGMLYYAKSNTNGGNALADMTTGDIVKGLKAYTVSSVDDNNNYVILHTVGATVISQISINEELTMKYVPKPTVSTAYTENADSYTYTISYQDGATLHYTLPGGEEQTKVGGESLSVNVTKIGDLTAYATSNTMTSETVSQRVYAPTPAIANGDVYDFALLNGSMLKDYTLGTHGYGDAITIGGVSMKKPDAVVAKTLDRFAFTSEYTQGETTTDDKEWVLLSAGRLRANASTHDDKMAILNVKKGQYLTLTYSGAAVKYLAGGTATMAEGTDTLFSKKAYEIMTDGDLLLVVTANTKNCDITGISLASTETVTAPTIEARTEINKVTLRLGTSSFGKTVTAYYTIDGSTPTTSSTAVTKNGAVTVDESCTMKAYCVSETGVASSVTEYSVSLPASSKSASVVYDWLNLIQHSDTVKFATDGLTVYDKEYDSTNGWVTKQRKDFLAATNLDSKVSVRNGYKGLTYDTKNKTIRLTKPLAIHNLAVDDEIVIIYTGDGSLYSGAADEGDVFTINGKTGTAGTAIPSGAVLKVTKQKYENNYVVVTPSGTGSGKVFISSIYINHAAPTVANTPKCELTNVNLDKMESTYRFTFDEGAMLFYMNTADNETLAGSNTGTFDITVTESAKLKAWEVNGTLTSDTLSVTVYAPTPAPSTTGNFDFTEASEDLPADIEVTLDASKSVTVGGETLYKPSLLTAATFGDKFAFTETGSSNKIRIRTNHQLVFAKGTDMSMGLLNLKKGDIISFDYTGTITFANPSQVSVESSVVAARGMTRAVSSDLTSGTAYIVQADGDVLLKLDLSENSANISKMYIAAAPTASAAKALDFATAAEEYEDMETGNSTSVWFNGKTSAQTFKRLINDSDELPIDGKVSTESGSGEITIDGIKASNRHIAIHNLAVGDEILVRFYGGALTYDGHESKGNRVKVNGKTLAAQDTLTSGDVIVVEKVDYLNNYVVLKLDSKCSISGIFINREEIEKVWAPTIVESGKNTVLITAGRSSMDYQVTTYYTTDGTDPSDRNGIGGPYESYDVELLDGSLVPVKAISYSSSGKVSKIATYNIFADTRTEIVGVPVETSKPQVIYDLQGRKVETPLEGRIYIIEGKKVLYRRK